MHELNLIDKSFDTENTDDCTLSIQVDVSGLSFLIYHAGLKQYVAFRKYRFEQVQLTEDLLENLRRIFIQDELLSLPYDQVNFLFYSQRSTLIPASYFDEKYIQKYFEFNHPAEPDDELHYNYVEPLDTYNIFAISQLFKDEVIKQFGSASFYQQATPFISRHLKNYKEKSGWVYLGMNHAFFDVAVVSNGRLALYNTFQYVNETDLLYFVMYVYKQTGLNLTDVPLLVSGDLSMKQDYFDALKQYIPGIRYESEAGGILSPSLFSLTTCKYQNLLNLHNCESLVDSTKAEK